jgi:hypothetical protein
MMVVDKLVYTSFIVSIGFLPYLLSMSELAALRSVNLSYSIHLVNAVVLFFIINKILALLVHNNNETILKISLIATGMFTLLPAAMANAWQSTSLAAHLSMLSTLFYLSYFQSSDHLYSIVLAILSIVLLILSSLLDSKVIAIPLALILLTRSAMLRSSHLGTDKCHNGYLICIFSILFAMSTHLSSSSRETPILPFLLSSFHELSQQLANGSLFQLTYMERLFELSMAINHMMSFTLLR